MLNVNNQKSISRLSFRVLQKNKIRNIIAIIAIILTTVMFTTVFSVGISTVESVQLSTMRQVGNTAHAGFKFLTWQQYEKVKNDHELEDVSYDIVIGFGENQELAKVYTEIRYTEEKAAEWSFSKPTTGTLPVEKYDIATTTSVLDALGVPHELGAAVPLEFTANGKKYKETFILCGYWEQDAVRTANEAFLSKEYCDQVAPAWQDGEEESFDWENYSGSVNPSIYFSGSWDIEGQMEALKERCGFGKEVNEGINWAYMSAEVDAATMLLIAGILLLIMVSGYLIIYNIFYISVNSDIKFYGLLKTIGTTNKQLKQIVRRQAWILGLVGIPVGLFVGYVCSFGLIPLILGVTNLKDNYIFSVNPFIFAGSGLFTLVTLWFSCIKPCKLVSQISPVEAVRFTESTYHRRKPKRTKTVTPFSMAMENMKRTPKKTVSVVLSLSLSLLLLNATITVVNGFDMDKYIQNSVVSDFYITDASVINVLSASKIYNGVSGETIEIIKNLDGITEIGSVYMKEHLHKLEQPAIENAKTALQEYPDRIWIQEQEEHVKRMLEEEQTMYSHLYGVDDFVAEKMELYEGRIDMEKFRTGDYVIVSTFTEKGEGHFYEVGDKVVIDYGNGNKKEYEVMALGNLPGALGPEHSHLFEVHFTMYSEEFIKQTGEAGAMKTAFNVEPEFENETEDWISSYCENVETSLDYRSKKLYVDGFKDMQNMYLVVGCALSFILALIGVLNFINAVITSIQARKREFAILQSIGMTGKQLKQMLVYEGIGYILFMAVFVLTLGNLITYGIVCILANDTWFFSYRFIIWPIFACIPILLIFAVCIPVLCYKNMSRQSVVGRLRESE